MVAEELTLILMDLFQTSADTGKVPTQWKEGNISGIFKIGDKFKPENYCPVSLTSIICKVLEHIVHSHVMNFMKHLKAFNILADNQHGFRAKRSPETQLIQTINDLAEGKENGDTTYMAILDFSKAFNEVPHQRLLNKLHHHGIRNNQYEWLGDFLIGRIQCVVCDGDSSAPATAISGVPQGTVLGRFLFLLYKRSATKIYRAKPGILQMIV